MKITAFELKEIIEGEIEDALLKEGVFDAIKGGAAEIGRKVKSAAGDIKQAGQSASLRADLDRLVQSAGQQILMFQKKFQEMADRAKSLGMEQEEQVAKQELQALGDYMKNASNIPLGSSPSNPSVPSSAPKSNPSAVPPTKSSASSIPKPKAGKPPADIPPDISPGPDLPEPSPISPEQAAMLGGDDDLSDEPIPLDKPKVKPAQKTAVKRVKPRGQTPLTISKVRDTLKQTGNSVVKAADTLGVSADDLINFVAKHSQNIRKNTGKI